MNRLNIVVEGQSEETFVRRVLSEALASRRVWVAVRCVETSRRGARKHRGGVTNFAQAKRDVTRWMREDQNPDAWFTTMFDLYRLPSDFPGVGRTQPGLGHVERVRAIEDAMSVEIDHQRFLPYIQLHEFEALLLCDPSKFSIPFPSDLPAVDRLTAMARSFPSPKLIDDGEETSPSRRIIKELPEYARRKFDVSAAVSPTIGLGVMRAKCPHFNEWVARLEQLGDP